MVIQVDLASLEIHTGHQREEKRVLNTARNLGEETELMEVLKEAVTSEL